MQIEASGAKINREQVFPSLAAITGKTAPRNNFKESLLFSKLLGAKGGDNLLDIAGG